MKEKIRFHKVRAVAGKSQGLRHAAAAFIVFSLILSSLMPSLPWIAFWVGSAALLFEEFRRLSLFDKKAVTRLTLIVLGVATLFASLRAMNYQLPNLQRFQDDSVYFNQSADLARAWQDGIYVKFTQLGPPPYMGTIHVGYQRILATLFYFTGPSVVAGLIFNAFLCALLVPLTAFSLRYIAEEIKQPIKQPTWFPRFFRTPVAAGACLAAFFPTQLYWSSFILKDVLLAAVFMVTILSVFAAVKSKNLLAFFLIFLGLQNIYYIRIYAAFGLIIGMLGLAILMLPRKHIVTLIGTLFTAGFITVRYTEWGIVTIPQWIRSAANLAPLHIQTSGEMLSHLFGYIPRFVLSPYAWVSTDVENPMYGIYPGMWYLYLIVYPLALGGFYDTLTRKSRLAAVPTLALWVGAFTLIAASYAGNAARQRYYLEYVFLLFAGLGLLNFRYQTMVIIYILQLVFITGQLLLLKR